MYFNMESPSDDYRYLGSPVLDFDCRDEDILEKSTEYKLCYSECHCDPYIDANA